MQKILLVTEGLGSGGAERQLVGLAIMLKNKGFNVEVLTYYNQNFYKQLLDANGIKNELYEAACNKYFRVFRLCKKVNYIHPDVTISFLPGSNVALGLGKMLKILDGKLVVSERNYTWNWDLKTKLYFSLYRFSDAVIANSKAEAENIKLHFPSIQAVVDFIPNFVESNRFVPRPKISNPTKHILTIARIRDYKNVHGLIKAASQLINEGYDLKFSWYGHNYGDDYLAKIQQMLTEYHIEERFKLYPPTSSVEKLYTTADFFCLPSFKEGYPNVVIEAMSCQIPVLCSNLCENPTIVEDGINGFLFNPYSTDSIVETFKSALSLSEEKLKEIGIHNREKVLQFNSEEAFVNRYIEVINSLTV